MRGRAAARFLPVAVAVLFIGCALRSAPQRWLPEPEDAQKEAFGAWMTVNLTDSVRLGTVVGEFIAVEGDTTVFLLCNDSLRVIRTCDIYSARVEAFTSHASLLGLWTVLGILSTPSHGYGAVISAPAWLLAGSIATVAQSFAPIAKFPDQKWNELRKFARFPAGLPPGLDWSQLHSKPRTTPQAKR